MPMTKVSLLCGPGSAVRGSCGSLRSVVEGLSLDSPWSFLLQMISVLFCIDTAAVRLLLFWCF